MSDRIVGLIKFLDGVGFVKESLYLSGLLKFAEMDSEREDYVAAYYELQSQKELKLAKENEIFQLYRDGKLDEEKYNKLSSSIKDFNHITYNELKDFYGGQDIEEPSKEELDYVEKKYGDKVGDKIEKYEEVLDGMINYALDPDYIKKMQEIAKRELEDLQKDLKKRYGDIEESKKESLNSDIKRTYDSSFSCSNVISRGNKGWGNLSDSEYLNYIGCLVLGVGVPDREELVDQIFDLRQFSTSSIERNRTTPRPDFSGVEKEYNDKYRSLNPGQKRRLISILNKYPQRFPDSDF